MDCAAVVVRAVSFATTRARRNRRDIDRASARGFADLTPAGFERFARQIGEPVGAFDPPPRHVVNAAKAEAFYSRRSEDRADLTVTATPAAQDHPQLQGEGQDRIWIAPILMTPARQSAGAGCRIEWFATLQPIRLLRNWHTRSPAEPDVGEGSRGAQVSV